MKLAFVIRIGTESRPSEGFFEGWVEEIDSCTERRFHSTAELLSFLGQCFDKVASSAPENSKGEKKSLPRKKKDCHETDESHELRTKVVCLTISE